MIKYFCDKCEQEMPKDRQILLIKIAPAGPSLMYADICPVCTGKITEFIQVRGVPGNK